MFAALCSGRCWHQVRLAVATHRTPQFLANYFGNAHLHRFVGFVELQPTLKIRIVHGTWCGQKALVRIYYKGYT